MTISEPELAVVIDGYDGIESTCVPELAMTTPQYGGQEVAISAATTGPWMLLPLKAQRKSR